MTFHRIYILTGLTSSTFGGAFIGVNSMLAQISSVPIDESTHITLGMAIVCFTAIISAATAVIGVAWWLSSTLSGLRYEINAVKEEIIEIKAKIETLNPHYTDP